MALDPADATRHRGRRPVTDEERTIASVMVELPGSVTPGLVCGHHHLYSSLARGMPAPPGVAGNFTEILDLVWWRLDDALDLEMVRWSAMLGALEALERGTTAIVDHHASPSAIDGSLDVIAQACAEVGVRVSCCYEVTDRHGADGARRGLAENERFLRAGGRGYVGAHACLTLSDDTLASVVGLADDLGVGVHIHVAEDLTDIGAGARLAPHANDEWLMAHCVHLDRRLRGTIAHNPRSNMNNAVGYAHPADRPNPVVLGTDGIGGDMLEEFRLAFAALRASDVTQTPDTAWDWLAGGWALFPEALDDRVTWTYDPMEPWHLAYTPGVSPKQVVVDGEVVLLDGRPTRVDADEVRARAAEQAARLHARL
jgi:cytosine/adenosine deaminase-related metal-dependent hydrolase